MPEYWYSPEAEDVSRKTKIMEKVLSLCQETLQKFLLSRSIADQHIVTLETRTTFLKILILGKQIIVFLMTRRRKKILIKLLAMKKKLLKWMTLRIKKMSDPIICIQVSLFLLPKQLS